MRPQLHVLAVAVLTVAGLALAGTATALEDDQSHEHGHEAEHHPDCRADEGERHPSAFTIDPTQVDRTLGTDLFEDDEKIPVEGHVTTGEDEEQVATFCSGENWDGQDPNTKESDRNSEAGGEADEPLVDTGEGTVYVNPLWDGDCSGWNSDHHADGGCEGGTQRPALTEVIHLRATADAPGTDDPDPEISIYHNGEGWGLGRESVSVTVDLHEDGDRSDEGGWVAIYLEDHSDQASEATIGTPLCDHDIASDCFDGNYLLIPFDPLQGGEGGEGDCTSHEYQDAQGNERHEDHEHGCETDSSSFTLAFSYSWLETPGTPSQGPPALP